MNTACKLLCAASLALLFAACASTPKAGLAGASANRFAVDQDYVAAVERASRSAGVKVVWVNPPRTRDDED